jgi:hypothetical protein
MYEKPLYPTPDGYRRSDKNPNKNHCLKDEVLALLAQKARLQKNNQIPDEKSNTDNQSSQKARLLQCSKKKVQISEKSAQLLAQAIKSLLKSK